ncbi:MAG: septation protein SpoVG [Ruminococcaceae bacterium]|nr:septation protein SpoVG [Oscillospiraceae bacterium]
MNITQIVIRKQFTEGPLKAIFSVTFDDELVLHDVKLVENKDKKLIVMPNRKDNEGKYIDIAHPINSKFRNKLEQQILKYYLS